MLLAAATTATCQVVATSDTAKTLVHAFVSSRIDYCNSMLYGVSDGLLKKLQAVQNAAARVVTGARKFDHITPVLRDLHWLPVRQRIKYKLAMTVLNACMDWRQLTWSTTVMQFPLSPASDIFGLQTLGHYSCQGRRQHWG